MMNLKNLRESKGLSQSAVARELNISRQTYNNYELGKREADYEMLLKLAEFFDTSVEFLLTGDSTRPAEPNADMSGENTYYRPIYASVSAGFGALGDNIAIGLMPLYISNPADVEDTICVKVSGDSMYPKIEDGDTIVVRKQDTLQDGEIGVIRFGDEFFVKRVEFEKNALRLISINPEYAPRLIEGPDLDQAEIVGKVVKIVKDL